MGRLTTEEFEILRKAAKTDADKAHEIAKIFLLRPDDLPTEHQMCNRTYLRIVGRDYALLAARLDPILFESACENLLKMFPVEPRFTYIE